MERQLQEDPPYVRKIQEAILDKLPEPGPNPPILPQNHKLAAPAAPPKTLLAVPRQAAPLHLPPKTTLNLLPLPPTLNRLHLRV